MRLKPGEDQPQKGQQPAEHQAHLQLAPGDFSPIAQPHVAAGQAVMISVADWFPQLPPLDMISGMKITSHFQRRELVFVDIAARSP